MVIIILSTLLAINIFIMVIILSKAIISHVYGYFYVNFYVIFHFYVILAIYVIFY